MAEIQAMEGMTEQQMEAYLKQNNRTQRMHDSAKQEKAQKQISDAQNQMEKAQKELQLNEEIRKITNRMTDITRLNEKEKDEVVAQIAEIKAKYQKQIDIIPVGGETEFGVWYHDAEFEKVLTIRKKCDVECFTLWRSQVGKMMERIKSKLADAPRYDELITQTYEIRGFTSTAKASKQMTCKFSIASEYLNIASLVTSLP